MSDQLNKITRENLYVAVWAKTLKSLAKEWNTTYLRLAQSCQEMEIPRPSQGYWQAIALGHTVKKMPLPASTENIPQEIELLPQGMRRIKTSKKEQVPLLVEVMRSPLEAPKIHTQAVDLAQAAEKAILDLLRQARKINFWSARMFHRLRPDELTNLLGLEPGSKIAESRLIRAIKNVRKEFKSFQVNVEEIPDRYNPSLAQLSA
jgi:hypothetical protein